MGLEAPSHWVILLIAAALLFGGYKKLPEMSRSVGRSLRIFKTEMKGMTDDDAAREAAETPQAEQHDQTRQAVMPPVVPPSLGADVPPAPAPGNAVPAAEASRETPQQQARS